MKFKGSDGIWDISQELVNGVEHVCIREQKEYDTQNNRLVSLISPVTEYDERDFWNAKLIMCAPEMLEMLNNVKDLFTKRQMPNEHEVNMFSVNISELINRAIE